MNGAPRRARPSPPAALAGFAARRPRLVVALALVVLALSALSLSRMRMSPSLEAMLGGESDTARAFHHVTTDFRAVEALFVIVESGDDPGAAAGFADALAQRLTEDPRTSRLIVSAASRRDPAFQRFVAEHALPAAAYYFGPDGAQELLDRLQPERLARQFARNAALMAAPGPAGDALARRVLLDPLRLFELAQGGGVIDPGALASGPQGKPPHEFSLDGRAALVRITADGSINDLRLARVLTRHTADIAGELRRARADHGVSFRLAGPYAIAEESSTTIRDDAVLATALAIALVYLLFVLFLGRWTTPLIIGVAAGAGMAAGFGARALGQPEVSPLATIVAALLAGLGVDYALHFVAYFDDQRARGAGAADAAARAADALAAPITTTCFTSIFGFIALWPSQIRMLSDFAKLGGAGLLGAWLAVFTLLPAMLVLLHPRGRPPRRAAARSMAFADAAQNRPVLLVCVACALLAPALLAIALRPQAPALESDLTVLHPSPNPALRATDELLTRFDGQGEVIPVLVETPDAASLLPAAYDAARALSSARLREIGVEQVVSIHTLLPDPRVAGSVRAVLASQDAGTLLGNFDSAVEASPFDPGAYEGYRDLLRRILTATEPPGVAALAAEPSIARRLYPVDVMERPENARQTVLIVRLREPLRERGRRAAVLNAMREALGEHPGATIGALAAVSDELETAAGRDLPRSIAISLALVLCWLVVMLRRPADVALALVPLVFAAVCVLGGMIALGVRFNPINIVAIPLLFGVAVDAGVFPVAAARRAREGSADPEDLIRSMRPTMRAVFMAAATTVTGFLTLCVTHTPAIRSLGALAALGVACSFIAAWTLVATRLLARRA